MTNQPRSSRSSAACERPAPDNPVMITNSLMVGACFSQWRKRRRGMVAAASYSAARARNPGGGAGSSMRRSGEPGVGERVHVAGQRPVDERDEHALLHLLDGLVLHEVGADPPVLLGRVEDLVVDPAAVRASGAAGGSGRRGTGRRAPAPGPPRAMAASTSRMCSNTRQATTASKRAGAERQRRRRRPGRTRRRRRAAAASTTWRRGGVDADGDSAPPRRAPAGRSGPRRSRRRARGRAPARCARGQRQDLLLVLRVGARR